MKRAFIVSSRAFSVIEWFTIIRPNSHRRRRRPQRTCSDAEPSTAWGLRKPSHTPARCILPAQVVMSNTLHLWFHATAK